MITLYDYWRSSAAYRLRIALNLLGLPHDRIPVDLLRGEHRHPANLARNPQGLVPTLVIDGISLTQSLAIIEYLDETRGPVFLPTDPAGRARVRALSYAVAMEVAPVGNLSVRQYAQTASGGVISADAWQCHFVTKGLAALEVMLDHPATGRFCHGDAVSMADLCLVPQVYNAGRIGVDLTPWPQISRLHAALAGNPAVAAAHPDRCRSTA